MGLVKPNLHRIVFSRTKLPGRYLLANLFGGMLSKFRKEIKGRIGEHVYQFDLADPIQRLMYFGLYEQVEIELMATILKPGDLFLDIGANVGYYSFKAAQFIGANGQVHAFEPVSSNVERFRSAIQRNGIDNIFVNQLAVGEVNGTVTLHLSENSHGNSGWASMVPSDKRPVNKEVRQVTIDHYIQGEGIKSVRLIKIDIEGAEPEAIAGMGQLLVKGDAPEIICELNPWLLERRGLDTTAITQPLAAYGYCQYIISNTGIVELDATHPVTKLTNIYCHKQSTRGGG